MQHLAVDYTEIWISSAVVPLVPFASKVRSVASTGIDLVGVGNIPVDSKLAGYLAGFDSIVSWYGANRREFREAMLAINRRCEFLAALPPTSFTDHATTFFNAQVGTVDSVPRLALPAPYEPPRGSVTIHPFSGGSRKNWPLQNFRSLARQLPCTTEWLAGPEEELPGATRFDGLLELAHWLHGSALYVGNDSGITHLAAALGVPVIALFGPTDPNVWAPRGDHVTVLRCEPISALPVETVAAAALDCLKISSSPAASNAPPVCVPR